MATSIGTDKNVFVRENNIAVLPAAAFAAVIPGATLREVPAAGHFLPEEAPEQLAKILASHLAP